MDTDRQGQAPELRTSSKGEIHRQRILDSALSLFMRKGFHQTSMRDIAREAGVSLGNAYNHFAGKRDLILAAATLESGEQDDLIAALREATGPEAARPRFVDAFYRSVATRETAALTAEIMAESLRDPEIGTAFSRNRRRFTDALAKTLDLSEDGSADALLDLVEGRALRDVLEDSVMPGQDAPEDLHRMAARLWQAR